MKILIIAPHADDEIIGVGGTAAKCIANGGEVYVCVVTRGAKPLFDDEYVLRLREETLQCHKLLGVTKTYFLEFPAVMLEKHDRYLLNDGIYKVISEVAPDEVYIPHIGDMQKDHQLVAEASMVALRPKYDSSVKRIYAYETLSETGWNIPNIQNEFIANSFSDISDYLNTKLEAMGMYKSQLAEFPAARSVGAIEALAKYRGAVMNLNAAEAFMLIREIK